MSRQRVSEKTGLNVWKASDLLTPGFELSLDPMATAGTLKVEVSITARADPL